VNVRRGGQRRQYALAFGQVLRRLRTEQGLTQEELAFRGGLDRTFPSLLERGLRTPTLTVICILAQALQMTPGELVAQAAQRVREPDAGEAGE